MSFDPNAIGNRIFTLRTNAKLSQEKLAEKLGVSHRHLGDLERGSSNGSVKILIDIAPSTEEPSARMWRRETPWFQWTRLRLSRTMRRTPRHDLRGG